MKIIKAIILCTVAALALCSCTKSTTKAPQSTAVSAEKTDISALTENTQNITIELENGYVIKAELYPDIAPITVKNFTKLIEDKFFDGLIFHRVIEGFMIQGGGYDKNMTSKKADSIKGEFASNGVDNPLKHERGVLSMARTNKKDSASSQFFIMHKTSPHLDGEYAAFGKVTEGMEFVDAIAAAKTTTYQNVMSDVPVDPIIIKTITLDE